MRDQKRITVLLGAGTMMEVTKLSCYSITQNVIAKRQNVFRDGKWEAVPFLNSVYEQLKAYYTKESKSVNFEDIFHALEMLSSIQTANDEQAVKSFRSVFGMLCNIKEEFAHASPHLVYVGIRDLIETVIEYVAEFESEVYKEKWFPNFFRSIQEKMPMDVFTLNYDTWLEQIIEDYNDGFVPICETHQKFSANQLFSNNGMLSTINHLHGQICFTTHLPTGSSRYLTDGWYKANSFEIIRNLRVSPKYLGYMAKTQAAEHVYQYPIITGLRKNDKIMTPPFDAYYTHLYQQLRNNKNLLIIGYGFGDLYINGLLNQFRNFHGSDGKVVCIGYLNPKKRVSTMADMPVPNTMKQSICMLFDDPELSYRFLDLEECTHIASSDGKSQWYLGGFKSTVLTCSAEILHFFNDTVP